MPWPLWLTRCVHFSRCNRRLKYFLLVLTSWWGQMLRCMCRRTSLSMTETNWDPKMEFQSGTLFQWICGRKFFIPCYNHVVLRIMAAWHLKVTLQKSYFELVFPIFYTWFSLALWVAKAIPEGEVLIGAHLCFHRNSNLFQSIYLWYLKRKGEKLFQFAWQNSFTWAMLY